MFDIERQRIGFAQRFNCPAGLSINSMEVCTDDSKVCDDGSFVRRDPSNHCEFQPCDRATVVTRTDKRTVADLGSGESTDNSVVDEQTGNGINTELDGQGASTSGSDIIHVSSSEKGVNHKALGHGSMKHINGLPLAEGSNGMLMPRIGPAVINAKKILLDERSQPSGITSAEWSLLGFFIFIAAFFLTVFFTQETARGRRSNPFLENSTETSPEDDTANAIKAWQKGTSFYTKSSNTVTKSSTSSKDGRPTRRESLYDRAYWDISSSSGMEGSSSKNKSSLGSFGSFLKLKSFYSTSSSDSPGTNRPYYQIQKSAKSMISESTNDLTKGQSSTLPSSTYPSSNFDRRQSWHTPSGQMPSTGSDILKYVKPVNSDDRSIFTKSSSSSSVKSSQRSIGSENEEPKQNISSGSRQQVQQLGQFESEISGDHTIFTKSSTTQSSRRTYDQSSPYIQTDGNRLGPQKLESEVSRDHTIYTKSSSTSSRRFGQKMESETSQNETTEAAATRVPRPRRIGEKMESETSRNETILTKTTAANSSGVELPHGMRKQRDESEASRNGTIFTRTTGAGSSAIQVPYAGSKHPDESEVSRNETIFTKTTGTGSRNETILTKTTGTESSGAEVPYVVRKHHKR